MESPVAGTPPATTVQMGKHCPPLSCYHAELQMVKQHPPFVPVCCYCTEKYIQLQSNHCLTHLVLLGIQYPFLNTVGVAYLLCAENLLHLHYKISFTLSCRKVHSVI